MQRPYNDRWERTRRHLLRNLFDNDGDLSPIPEEPGSEGSDSRPCSPLPDLIVEREPNRHDHSDEFYEALAVRMRRYYKRLFIDGVSDPEASLNDAEDIPDFETNRSMASTFIIDTNNHVDEERCMLVANEPGEEFDSINNVDEIRERQTPDKDASKSIETESDLVEVHGEVQRVRAPRVFEDGSPVLMPKAHELSRTVFRKSALKVRNIMSSVRDDEENQGNSVGEEIKGYDRNIQLVSREIEDLNQCKTNKENSDFEVECLIKNTDNVSNKSQGLIEICEEEETVEEINQNQTPESTSVELDEFYDESREAIGNESPLQTSESDEIIQIQNEDSIGPNEFDSVELTRKARHLIFHEEVLEPADSSFERALHKGLFETKNARKNQVPSSDEEFEDDSYENDDFEPVEEMRGTMQTRLTETLQRESTLSKESPLVKFATPQTAEDLEEDNFDHGDSQINGPYTVMTETRDEDEDRSLQINLTSSEYSSDTDVNGTDDAAEELSVPGDLECVTSAPIDKENRKKRASDPELDINAPMNKKKRYNDIAIQTAASKDITANWDNVQNNFFVGKPLVFRLCSCHDHVCL